MLSRRQFVAGGVIGLLSPSVLTARAQAYPSQTITIVVPYAAGGGSDIVARLIGQRLQERLGVPVVVDNKPGATTAIGTQYVARAPADGHTLLITAPPFVIGRYTEPKPPYDSAKDFAPLCLTTSSPLIVTAGVRVKANTFAELLEFAKANPGKLNYGSTGNMGLPHLGSELLAKRTGTSMVHVPYRGGGPVVNDLLSGQVDLYLGNPLEVAPHFASGLKPLAVTSKERMQLLPSIPTLQELGVPDYDLQTWTGMLAPAATPAAVVEKLNSEISAALASPDIKQKLSDQFTTPMGGPIRRFSEFLDQQHALFSELVPSL